MLSREQKIIKKLLKELPPADYDSSWMGDEPNKAFIVSLGAGPWQFKRRQNVQVAALTWYLKQKVQDLSLIKSKANTVYPLAWENKFLSSMIASLKEEGISFTKKCKEWKKSKSWTSVEESLLELFDMCGTSNKGPKVLWMFARDFLGLPAFPIDRHVHRNLVHYNLPVDSWEITRISFEAKLDCNDLNRRFFTAGNPIH